MSYVDVPEHIFKKLFPATQFIEVSFIFNTYTKTNKKIADIKEIATQKIIGELIANTEGTGTLSDPKTTNYFYKVKKDRYLKQLLLKG